ncbi:hypothetical protein pb186bvf_014241 [Paramecium bursaria]
MKQSPRNEKQKFFKHNKIQKRIPQFAHYDYQSVCILTNDNTRVDNTTNEICFLMILFIYFFIYLNLKQIQSLIEQNKSTDYINI